MSTQEQVDALRKDMESRFPNFELLYKEDDDWYKQAWYLWVIWAFFRVVGVVAPGLRDQFDQNYSNGLYSKMVLTNRERHGDWTNAQTFRLVLHEYRHMLDTQKHPLWMPLSYIFLLPAVFTMRAYWELRCFTAELLGCYISRGTIPDQLIDNAVWAFSSSMYFWMFPFPKYVRKYLEARREDIYAGKITLDMDW